MQIDAKPIGVTEALQDAVEAKLQDRPVRPEIALTFANWLAEAAGDGSLVRAFANGQDVETRPLLRELDRLRWATADGRKLRNYPGPRWLPFHELDIFLSHWGLSRRA